MSRRKFLKVAIGGGAVAAIAGAGTYIVWMQRPKREPSPPNIAYCGENCVPEVCPHLAAGACDGCHAAGPDPKLSDYCRNCQVRLCGQEKGFETCADCEDYPCDELEELWGISDGNHKATLDQIRESKI